MLRLAGLPLLLALMLPVLRQEPKEPPDAPPSQAAADEPSSQSQPAEGQGFPRSPTQAKILEELLREQGRDRVQPILSAGGIDAEIAAESGTDRLSLLTDGARIYEKLGRLVTREGRVEFHFSAGGLGKEIRPVMVFNKNQLLELMEREAERGVVEFIITADVARYRGENYLTLLKYRRQVAHGNLSP